MANTNSWAWPNMINVAQNRISIYEDNQSVVSRGRLLMLTEPTELYNEPNQGVGLKRYMYRYNQPNVKAEIRDRCAEQFDLHDPQVNGSGTQWADSLLFSGTTTGSDTDPAITGANKLEMTISMETKYGEQVTMDLNKDIIQEGANG